jgi:serpin B
LSAGLGGRAEPAVAGARPIVVQFKRQVAVLCAVVVCAAAISGCAAVPNSPGRLSARVVVLTSGQVAALRSFGAGDTAFGLVLLSAVCRRQPGANVVISPVSLATGLGMAYLGAHGATAAAMARVLRLPATGRGLIAGLRARRALLASLTRPGVTFADGNRLWPTRRWSPAGPSPLPCGRATGPG